jgi:hypothetical protein
VSGSGLTNVFSTTQKRDAATQVEEGDTDKDHSDVRVVVSRTPLTNKFRPWEEEFEKFRDFSARQFARAAEN